VKSPGACATRATLSRALRCLKLALPVIGCADCRCVLATNSHPIPWLRSGGDTMDTMVITEIGYLFLTLSAVAVLLFCWLGFACLTGPRRDK